MIFRAGTDGDLPGVVRIFEKELDTPAIASRLRYRLASCPSAVAQARDTTVGFALTSVFSPDIYEITNMVVSPGFRDRGIGGRLLATLEALLPEAASALLLVNSQLWPSASGQKRSAERFYARHGFSPAFRTPASIVMTKVLGKS